MANRISQSRRLRLTLGCALLVSTMFCMAAVPSPIWLVPFALTFLFFQFTVPRISRKLQYILLILLVWKIAAILALVYECKSVPMRSKSYTELFWKYFPFSCLFFGDVGQWENEIATRRSLVVSNKGSEEFRGSGGAVGKVDPFSGLGYLRHASVEYSVGPDQQDQQMKVIYDPSNGTVSAGDIPVGFAKRRK